jgi:hypothetical protein
LLLLAAQLAAAIDCPERLTREDLATQLAQAEQAWADLDPTGFRDRTNTLAGLVLPCMGDLVPPELAARTHRLLALQRFELGDPDAAATSMAAARATDGSAEVPAEWLPAEHPLRTAWAGAEPPGTVRVPEPRVGTLAFDGRAGRERPRGVPTLVQRFDAAGVAQSTAYLGPREALPDYEAIPRRRRALTAGAIGAGAAGAGLLVGSWLQYRGLLADAADPAVPADALTAQRATVNVLFVLGGGLVGAGAGLGVGAAAVGPR